MRDLRDQAGPSSEDHGETSLGVSDEENSATLREDEPGEACEMVRTISHFSFKDSINIFTLLYLGH